MFLENIDPLHINTKAWPWWCPAVQEIWCTPCADPEGGGGQGARTPLKNHKKIGFLSNSGPDPLKNHKDTDPALNVGPSSARERNAI